jgi:phosphatidate cytidylyltransferase
MPLTRDPKSFQESFHEARQRALDLAQNAQDFARDTQEWAREAQERGVELARQRAAEAQERARRAAEAMPPGLLVRLLSAVVGLPLVVALVFAEGVPPYTALPFTFAVAICATLGGYEFFRGARLRGFQPLDALAFPAIGLFQLAAWSFTRDLSTKFLPGLLALLVIATLVSAILRRERQPLANVGVTFLGVIYVGWLFSYLIFLRSIPGTVDVPVPFINLPDMARGAWLVLYVIAVTWSTDTGAYFAGVRFGKRKLAPTLSPNKTIEGAIGGLIAATAMSLAWGAWIGLPLWHCLVLGPVLGALGQVGDLCESALKRDLGIKDFGALLPGHGGILDRFDSLLFTAPVAYYYFLYVAAMQR